jgi:hypothetical protein
MFYTMLTSLFCIEHARFAPSFNNMFELGNKLHVSIINVCLITGSPYVNYIFKT